MNTTSDARPVPKFAVFVALPHSTEDHTGQRRLRAALQSLRARGVQILGLENMNDWRVKTQEKQHSGLPQPVITESGEAIRLTAKASRHKS